MRNCGYVRILRKKKIKLLIVSARPGKEGEQRDGAARSISAVKATLALAGGGTRPPGASGGIPALPGPSRLLRRGASRGSGEGDEKTEQKWEGDKVAGADLL